MASVNKYDGAISGITPAYVVIPDDVKDWGFYEDPVFRCLLEYRQAANAYLNGEGDENDAWDRLIDAEHEVNVSEPITLLGLLAKLEFVAQQMRANYIEEEGAFSHAIASLPNNLARVIGRFKGGDPI